VCKIEHLHDNRPMPGPRGNRRIFTQVEPQKIADFSMRVQFEGPKSYYRKA
jgi:hypothetical protein